MVKGLSLSVAMHLPRGAVSLCEWCHSSWMQRPPFSSRPAHGSPRTSQHRHYQRQRRGWCWWTAGWLTAWSSALHGQYPHHHGCWTPVFQQQKAWTHINAAILDATLSWEDKGLVTRVQIFGLDPESWSDQWNHKPFVILIHSSSTSVRLRIWVCHQTLFLVRGWVWAWRWSYDLVSWNHTIFCCPVYHTVSQHTIVPYSRKLLREKTFMNFAVLWLFAKVISTKFGSVVSFAWHKWAIHKNRIFTEFSPSIVSRYTVSQYTTLSQYSTVYQSVLQYTTVHYSMSQYM